MAVYYRQITLLYSLRVNMRQKLQKYTVEISASWLWIIWPVVQTLVVYIILDTLFHRWAKNFLCKYYWDYFLILYCGRIFYRPHLSYTTRFKNLMMRRRLTFRHPKIFNTEISFTVVNMDDSIVINSYEAASALSDYQSLRSFLKSLSGIFERPL